MSVFVVVFIVVVAITVVRVYARQAIIHRSLQTRVVTNAPAATTVITTTTQNSTPQTAGFDPSKGYTGYTAPPGYPTTGSIGYPATAYPAPGYPATGYPATGYPTTGSTGYPAPGYPATGYPGAPPPYPS